MPNNHQYEAVIGLEIHIHLNSPTKLFCDCPNHPGEQPNQYVCPTCLWLPGAFPHLSWAAVEKAALACLALHCEIQPRSVFDQKVYYYPDLPKGYQLSQFHRPLARNGWLEIPGEDGRPKRLRIHEIHMEEDVAKLVHDTEGSKRISLVDFNRAGAPLIEIVTEPDLRGPHDAMEFLRALRTQIRYVDAAECSLERGTMRADANISIRPAGSEELNTKVEVKNMNSIRHVGDAIAYEIQRQIAQVQAGEAVRLHTRLWNPEQGITTPMRAKFSGPCVPDPTVPPIVIDAARLAAFRARLPELPAAKRRRFMESFGLPEEEAQWMTAERDLSEYYEAVAKQSSHPRAAAHWIAEQLLPALKEQKLALADNLVDPPRLAALLALVERGEINATAAKEVFDHMFASQQTPAEIVEQRGLRQMTDTMELESLVDRLLEANPGAVENIRKGKAQAIGFLVGQAMRESQGKADPKRVREIIAARVGGG